MTGDLSVWNLILNAGPVVKGVLVLLVLLSIISWAVILNKWRLYRKTRREADEFSSAFWGGKDMDTVLAGIQQRYPNSSLPNIFQAGYREYTRTGKIWEKPVTAALPVCRSQAIPAAGGRRPVGWRPALSAYGR